MKITFVLPKYPLNPVGGFRVVYEYANALTDRGHEVTIVHPAYLPKKPLPNGLLNKLRVLKNMLPPPKRPEAITWQHIDDRITMLYKPTPHEKNIPNGDAVIATGWHTADYVNDYSPAKGEKFYLIQHYETWDGPEDRVNKTWMYPLHKIVIAKWLFKVGEKLGANDMTHIPNAIDHEKFRLLRPIEGRKKRIAMLYHHSKWKGTADGIKAIEIIKNKHPEVEVVFFGIPEKGADVPEYVQYFQNPEQEVLIDEVYNKSSIFLSPSLKEGWGLPSAEASACGCAIVSTENGGTEDFAKHGETALLSPPSDPQQLADNVIKLLEDDDLRVNLAIAGREYIQNFTYESSVNKLESLLYAKSTIEEENEYGNSKS